MPKLNANLAEASCCARTEIHFYNDVRTKMALVIKSQSCPNIFGADQLLAFTMLTTRMASQIEWKFRVSLTSLPLKIA
ncbi:hypothetical protein AB1N83_006437 [Pleurotus pulmonarius]